MYDIEIHFSEVNVPYKAKLEPPLYSEPENRLH
jgi:hypothetical protein